MTRQLQRQYDGTLAIVFTSEDVARFHLQEGQPLDLRIRPVTEPSSMTLDEAFELSWQRSEAAYRYLAGR